MSLKIIKKIKKESKILNNQKYTLIIEISILKINLINNNKKEINIFKNIRMNNLTLIKKF